MVRKYAAVFPARGEEVRLPPECLAEMGLVEGTRVVLEASPGRLLLTPFWDVRAVRSDLGTIATELEEIRARLRRVAGLLPKPLADAEPDRTDGTDPTEMFAVGIDLLGTLECLLADDLEPALAKLQEAVTLTLGQLEEGGA
jgi:antitoxin component of MazEF toxin-antitoxin module